jgi:FkbM family methyltransferase
VQIGSNDGVLNDPLHDTIRSRGWSGLLVEPIPRLFARLTANYQGVPGVRTANVAIAPQDGTVTMYEVRPRPSDPDWVEQIASLNREVVLRHSYALPDLEARIVPVEVASTTLPSLIDQEGITSIDLMHIDAEGHDDEIIRQIDMDAPWAPRYLIYENKHIDRQSHAANKALLRRAGYRVVNIWPDEFAYRTAPSASS